MVQQSRLFIQLGRREWANLGRAGFAAGCIIVTLLFLYQGFTSPALGNDFDQFHKAAQALLNGTNPYQEAQLIRHYAFVYPLWAVLPYLWVGGLSTPGAILAWLAVNLLLIAGSVWLGCLTYKLRPPLWVWPALFLIGLVTMSDGWITGQPTVVMAFFLGLGVWLLACQNQPLWASFSGVVFWAIKPQLTVLVGLVLMVWCLRAGLRRFWLGSVVSLLVVLVITLLWLPTWPLDYLQAFRLENTINDKWASTTLLDWLHFSFGLTGWPVTILYLFWLTLGLLVCGWFVRQTWQNRLPLVALVAIILGVWLAITPYTRDYDYALLILPICFIIRELLYVEKRRLAQIAGLGWLLFCLLYYMRGGTLMYEFFVINFSIAVLVAWRGWEKVRLHQKLSNAPQINQLI